MEEIFFADVILPLPLPQLYTYRIIPEMLDECKAGCRVVVQFGKKKFQTGIVRFIHQNKPETYETKDIVDVLDKKPLLTELSLKFWEWIANYYMCTIGEVMKAALPTGLKLESESKISINAGFDTSISLTEFEFNLLTIIEKHNTLTIDELQKLYPQRNPLPIVKSLVEKHALNTDEVVKESYKPKIEKYVSLVKTYFEDDAMHQLFDNLEKRAPKQLQLLMGYLSLNKRIPNVKYSTIHRNILLEKSGCSIEILNSMVKKGIFTIENIEVSRLSAPEIQLQGLSELNDYQQQAITKIRNLFLEKDVVLLHGVTSSGKTEIYIHLIKECIEKGKQVLYLLPEIALTTQIINRLQNNFGNKVGVYHSKFSDGERVEIWQNIGIENDTTKIQNGENSELSPQPAKYQIILGVRSSVFLPFENLGLIIIDEEHENTYKQFDPAPRYHARDTALVLARLHGAKTLLGTATPAIETYSNAKAGKYGLVELFTRFQEMELPQIQIVDIKIAHQRKLMKSHFSQQLLDGIKAALDNHEQVILFQNRRGFSPLLECKTCGWVPRCKHCDVSLTYHKTVNQLVCHYCGYSIGVMAQCKACGDTTLKTIGFGTEKIEDEMGIFFPKARLARMDLDSTRSKKAYFHIITEFENKNIDVLIGTQMVTKGLDFDNVSLVGILNADSMLNFPDFRAFERSYQLMAQVSGRAGRKFKRGKVIIQTSSAEHKIIKDVLRNDYISMFSSEMTVRQQFAYPPYVRLIRITLKHKKIAILDIASDLIANDLRQYFKHRVLGPQYPMVGRIQNWFLKTLLIKIERDKPLDVAKKYILDAAMRLKISGDYSSLQIVYDIDPM